MSQLTKEMIDKAIQDGLKQGATPRHVCSLDGHVEHFCSCLCAVCGEVIRELSVDENHVRLGEFW